MIDIVAFRDRLDAAWRLGPRPVALAAWHRAPPGRALARWRLRAPGPAALPRGPILATGQALPPAPEVPAAHRAAVLAAAAGLGRGVDWHGGYPASAPALALDLHAHGDIRPVWERSRWAALPLLVQAARFDPAGGHLDRAEALLAGWIAANPPFRGPNWACGQEAALRALHLSLALALHGGGGGPPPPAARALLALHARRIRATRAYAMAQDNNHSVSEPAGLLACGLGCGVPGWVRQGAAGLDAAVLRLVAPCGAFAQPSTGYHRLLLDVLAVAAWLARHHPGAGLSPPALARAAAAVRWLHRLACPETGALPRLGHQDGSAFADLSLAGPADARPAIERAARLLAGRGAGLPGDPGCAWLGLDAPAAGPSWPQEARWTGEGFLGWRAPGGARAVLRSGAPRLRFRPGHADLLHLDLWDGPRALLRDGGTGAYNPPAAEAWWHAHFTGTAAHNTACFDDADQMPRAGRFLFARWPRTGLLPGGDGAWMRDARGNRHARQVAVSGDGRRWTVEDRLSGPFREVALRWRLPPGSRWSVTPAPDSAIQAADLDNPARRLRLSADAPLAVTLEAGWESPAYGRVRPSPVLVARAAAPVGRIGTIIDLG